MYDRIFGAGYRLFWHAHFAVDSWDNCTCVIADCVVEYRTGSRLQTMNSRFQLLVGGAGSLLIKVGSMLVGLLLVVVLARTLGPEGYGVYAYVLVLVSLLAIPAQMGLPQLLVRETAKAHAQGQWDVMLGVWRWSSIAAGVLSLALILLAGTAAWMLSGHFSVLELATLAAGLALVPLLALGGLRDAALRGLHHVVQGQLADTILRPVLLILFVTGFLITGQTLTAGTAMGLHVLSAVLAFAAGVWLLHRARPHQLTSVLRPRYEARQWLASTIPLAMNAGMQVLNSHVDILVLGFFASATDVGVYRVVVQGATLVAFSLYALNMVIAPHVVRLYTERDYLRLQRLVTGSARVIFLLTLPLAFVFIFFGESVLTLAVGREYATGYVALAILSAGQLANAAFGSVGLLLNMTGHERDAVRGVGIAVMVNIVLNLILIPPFGLSGAATATAVTLLTWNLILRRLVWVRLNVESAVISRRMYSFRG